ncbi:MAG TPA: alpha/beta hydrolase [Bacteriovoracaceae bacterium]|nr:alpha/beta hydrolase [Bacteriovoracaceae bacterium]
MLISELKREFSSESVATAFLKCVDTWIEDFRTDLQKMDIPLLIIHGDSDKILPIDATSNVLKEIVGQLVVIKGGSHGIPWTHHEEVNDAILDFLGQYESTSVEKRVESNFQQSQIQ